MLMFPDVSRGAERGGSAAACAVRKRARCLPPRPCDGQSDPAEYHSAHILACHRRCSSRTTASLDSGAYRACHSVRVYPPPPWEVNHQISAPRSATPSSFLARLPQRRAYGTVALYDASASQKRHERGIMADGIITRDRRAFPCGRAIAPGARKLRRAVDPETEHLHLGLRLAERYRLTKDVATGSLCAIYGGDDTVLARHVIIKAIAPRRVPIYREALSRTAELTHPAIIATYDALEHEGWLFVVQEFVPHHALTAHLAAGIPASRALDLLAQLARLLAYTHDQGVVHGDLRPEAVLVDKQARVHVNNFCLPADPAYVQVLAEQLAFAAEHERGSDATIAPVLPEADSPAGDVWAAGALMWQLLSEPIAAASDDPTAERGEPRRVLRDDVPERVRVLIRRCCYPGEPDPITSAAALIEECEAAQATLQAGRPTAAPSTPLALRLERDGYPPREPISPFRSPLPRDPILVGGRASNSVFNAPTDPIFADAAATHPARPSDSGSSTSGTSRPGAPRISLPSRPIDRTYEPFVSNPPLWDASPRLARARRQTRVGGQVGLLQVLALGCVLFIIFFVIGFLWLGPTVLPR